MRCTHPRTVGFKADGKTLAWSQRERSKEYAPFQLPCGKCIECRLAYARDWAVRCVHEAQMHPQNSFVTLTYDDQHLKDPKLVYADFQGFIKRLRHVSDDPLSYIVAGEYGEQTKRPHWHAIIFNWYPKDATYFRSNNRGDKIYESKILTEKWQKGQAELGSVTFHSAGYVARYSAKKLVHGEEVEEYQPIFKVSSRRAIGAAWLEKYHTDIFNYGRLFVGGEIGHASIPRYYTKWLKKHKSAEWLRYVSQPKIEIENRARDREEKEKADFIKSFYSPDGRIRTPKSKNQIRAELAKIRFEQLQQQLKLK